MQPLLLDDETLERVETLADAERSARIVAEMLAGLPVRQREAVRLRILDERGYEEIATELRGSQAVVRQRVSRALSTLRTELSKETP